MPMSNNLSALMTIMLAKGLSILRKRVLLTRLVSREAENSVAAKRGSTIRVPLYGRKTATPVAPSHLPQAPSDTNLDEVNVPLDQWFQTDFGLNDRECDQIQEKDSAFMPEQMSACFDGLAVEINRYIASKYKRIGNAVGTPGATPFATDQKIINLATAMLNKSECPLNPRHGILDYDAGANFKNLATLADVDTTGENGVKIDGVLGRRYGVGFAEDGQIPNHTSGVLAAGSTIGAVAAGVKIVPITDGGGGSALLAGDVLSFAGDAKTYAVDADTAIGAGLTVNVTLTERLQVAQPGGNAVTLKASHTSNLLFHPSAFAFAMRPETEAINVARQAGAMIEQMSDPLTGLVFTLELQRQHKQTAWFLSGLYGAECVRPDCAARIMG